MAKCRDFSCWSRW